MFIKLYALLNKSEEETLEIENSELFHDADYTKAFQENFSFLIMFS